MRGWPGTLRGIERDGLLTRKQVFAEVPAGGGTDEVHWLGPITLATGPLRHHRPPTVRGDPVRQSPMALLVRSRVPWIIQHYPLEMLAGWWTSRDLSQSLYSTPEGSGRLPRRTGGTRKTSAHHHERPNVQDFDAIAPWSQAIRTAHVEVVGRGLP